MNRKEEIENAYRTAVSYPDLVQKLIELGIESYTVEVATQSTLYRLADGVTYLSQFNHETRKIADNFNGEGVMEAVIANQTGKIDYEGFMQAIADAGTFFYEATLIGDRKRVSYVGKLGFHEEIIPIS